MCMRNISIGYSPCPNDTFIFYALVHGKIDTEDFVFKETLLDVETLNRMALSYELDLNQFSSHAEMDFHRMMDSVSRGDVDAGLIIHEGRFTYHLHGLKQVVDLGEWWENATGLPLPLGGILAKRELGKDVIKKVDSLIRKSIEYSLSHRDEPKLYIKQHSQELEDKVIDQHINFYVNDYSLDIGEEGLSAVKDLFRKAAMKGMLKEPVEDLLCIT